ncbi:hypothetical protein TrVE_jg3581 [Triparma verrucosa]|uniref:Uncharacterized protein n=1 Tax=Triparma verrucosa TaxID=1606542 RepID=A0A9W7C682_9STRA|nr:hypothetical protein TrVE_jg3581 [Triparma verrucosa]
MENFLVVVAAVLWFLSAVFAYYFIAINKDIGYHRNFATRFTVITHTLPVVARLIGLFLWLGMDRPDGWSQDPLRASEPAMFPIITWLTVVIVLPSMEIIVYFEEGGAEDARNPIAVIGRWRRKRKNVNGAKTHPQPHAMVGVREKEASEAEDV